MTFHLVDNNLLTWPSGWHIDKVIQVYWPCEHVRGCWQPSPCLRHASVRVNMCTSHVNGSWPVYNLFHDDKMRCVLTRPTTSYPCWHDTLPCWQPVNSVWMICSYGQAMSVPVDSQGHVNIRVRVDKSSPYGQVPISVYRKCDLSTGHIVLLTSYWHDMFLWTGHQVMFPVDSQCHVDIRVRVDKS